MEDIYKIALEKTLKIREERRKLYGDSWINEPIEFDMWMCHSKIQRVIYQIQNGYFEDDKDKYESLEDNAIDLINYSIFLLSKIISKKLKNEVNEESEKK